MTELLTAAQMRAIEQAAIASGEVTGLELMERAGRGVVEAIFEEWPELQKTSHRAVVLCGPGNNGGDGFVVARLLKEWGWEVEVFLYGDAEKLPPDARTNYERWCELGSVTMTGFPQVTADATEKLWPSITGRGFDGPTPKPDVVIDALFGTGLSRPISGLGPVFDVRSECWPMEYGGTTRWVAVDIPSGLCADSGRCLGLENEVLRRDQLLCVDLTVTFHLEKQGHRLFKGPGASGRLVVASIGLRDLDVDDLDDLTEGAGVGSTTYLTDPLHGLAKVESHKYTHGHALILSGPPGQTGAARLAARGALRIGSGLVTIGAMPEAIPEHAAQLTAIMLRPVAEAGALVGVLEDRRINALCLGPGLGLDERARGLVAAALGVSPNAPPPPSPPHEGEGRHDGRPSCPGGAVKALPLPLVGRGEGRGARRIVLDADALTLIARDPALFAALHEDCIVTPHAGEFARLFPDLAAKLAAPATKGPAYSKVDATREAAKRAGCVVLYKGPDTVIADPQGRCSINSAHYDRAAPWLATAGSGDVLAGFITGLLARGFAPMAAAETAAWLHVECALSFGPGLIAEDLPEELPKVFRKLGL
ncbi:NAD(P)H-hydrate epimerase [Frigidibacter sp. SD6-1]|uniref:NAD(P)H-hydrate epimerase n=1 Tax=Frigidibacter sp. SD6-1 TaxID=3032581 RepID=UPI0024DFDF89|nr:NAD(P)H-hydrate epimerase [Frigidibacter sp. SD6-1]